MKKETELLKAIGDIDEKYILEAMPKALAQEEGIGDISVETDSGKDSASEKHSTAENGSENDKVIHLNTKRRFKPLGTVAAAIILALGFGTYMAVFNGNKEVLAPQAVQQDAASAEAVSGDSAYADNAEEKPSVLRSIKPTQMEEIANDVPSEAQAKTGNPPKASSDNALSEENTAMDGVKTEGVEASSEEKEDVLTMIANPWLDSSTLSDAEKDAGFDITIPESFLDYNAGIFRSMTGKMLEIIYNDAASHEAFRIRKSNAKDQDISGDYSSYENERTVIIDGTEITLKGTGDNVYVAIWTKDDHSYAIDIDSTQNIGESEITELVKQIS